VRSWSAASARHRAAARAACCGAAPVLVGAGFGHGDVEAVAGPAGSAGHRQGVQVLDGDLDHAPEWFVDSP